MALYLFLTFFFLGFAYWVACVVFSRQDPETTLPEPPERPVYPPQFLYGTATAAHQVEGGNVYNDWHQFEEGGNIARGEKSGRACEHWSRVSEDIALMTSSGSNAYRFSVEWSRLEPNEGSWDEAAWEHYVDELSQLRAAGITPMVTLLHFTLPSWLTARGGLLAPEFPEKFAAFAAEAGRRFWSMVEHWCTINEPNVQMFMGYLRATWPPQKTDPQEASRAFAALLRAHAAAAKELRQVSPEAQIGVAMNLISFAPHSRGSLLDWIATNMVTRAYNWAFYDSIIAGRIRFSMPGQKPIDEPLEALLHSADFVGINYYSRYIIRFTASSPNFVEWTAGPNERTDMGWEIYPEGLLKVLRAAYARYKLPIYITENGLADASGQKRPEFIKKHLHAIGCALKEGIPVKGYFHWSLMDNFEWAEGFAPRFGLYSMNYETMARTPAPGLEVFQEWAPTNPGDASS